jgi:hypothetical protein
VLQNLPRRRSTLKSDCSTRKKKENNRISRGADRKGDKEEETKRISYVVKGSETEKLTEVNKHDKKKLSDPKCAYGLNRSNTGIVGSNPARGMDVCPPFFCVVLSRVGRGLAAGRSPSKGSYQNV